MNTCWTCRCGLMHLAQSDRCKRCGEARSEAGERQAAMKGATPEYLTPKVLARLEELHERWAKGEMD